MEERFDIPRLLVLRKLTRAIADLLTAQLRDCLATLAPLIRPRAVFGEYVRGTTKETPRGADRAFEELKQLYRTLASSKPFNLPKELVPPIDIASTAPEISPIEYGYEARTERESKAVTVTSPLRWVLSYSGFAPRQFQSLLARQADLTGTELQQCVLHYVVLNLTIIKQSGVVQIFDAIRFPVSTIRIPEFGELPVTSITCPVSTTRPPDDVIIQSTEISGMPAFEEVVNLQDIVRMADPLRERLVEVAKSHGESLVV